VNFTALIKRFQITCCNRSGSAVILTALAYTAVTYIVFAHYLAVDLPLGPLTGAFRSVGLAR